MLTQTHPQTQLSQRSRRLRQSSAIRGILADSGIRPSQLVNPYFVVPGQGQQIPVASMPGVFQWSVDLLIQAVAADLQHGIQSVMLFGVPEARDKDAQGSGAHDANGLVQQATRELKKAFGDDLVVMTDTCLCEYTDHGHCGLVEENTILNDPSVEHLVKAALSQAEAGADFICPSDMMDGRVGAIRQALDTQGFSNVAIMAYAVKYASSFYGPFRDAAQSPPQFGDRRTYQMDPQRGHKEALHEAALVEAQGADILMIKPAVPYLDIIQSVSRQSNLPIAAYHVSGEYAMLKAAALNGWLGDSDSEKRVVMESLNSIKRAGADIIVTYFASDVARWLTKTQ